MYSAPQVPLKFCMIFHSLSKIDKECGETILFQPKKQVCFGPLAHKCGLRHCTVLYTKVQRNPISFSYSVCSSFEKTFFKGHIQNCVGLALDILSTFSFYCLTYHVRQTVSAGGEIIESINSVSSSSSSSSSGTVPTFLQISKLLVILPQCNA